jgi:hypothetical protein
MQPIRAVAALGMLSMLAVVNPGNLKAQELPESSVSFSGQIRLRGEWDGRTTGTGDDAAVLSRIRLGVRANARPWLRVFAQLQDHRAWGTESDPVEGTADALDLHQGYVDLTSGGTTLRLGRQEVGLGDERLIGPLAWANTGRSFDGALARREFNAGHVRVFWMNVAERDSMNLIGIHPQGNEGTDSDGWLIGAFVTKTIGATVFESMFLHDRKAATHDSYTAHGRLHGTLGPILYDGSGAYQFGPDLRAFLFSARMGVSVGRRGSVAAQLDYISGDADTLDATGRAFQTLYPTAHAYHGYMDYFVTFPRNTLAGGLIDAIARVRLPTPEFWSARADVHRFWLAQERSGSKQLGWETDLVVRRTLASASAVELGASVFAPEDLMTTIAPAFAAGADVTYWGYLLLIVNW